jgi:hypothetical protein
MGAETLQRGVSDHICGRTPGRPGGPKPWSLTPRDWCWRPHRQGATTRAAQSAARRRQLATCVTACTCAAGSPRASRAHGPGRILDADQSRGNTSRGGGVPPPCSPGDLGDRASQHRDGAAGCCDPSVPGGRHSCRRPAAWSMPSQRCITIVTLTIEPEREEDARRNTEFPDLPGVLRYGHPL